MSVDPFEVSLHRLVPAAPVAVPGGGTFARERQHERICRIRAPVAAPPHFLLRFDLELSSRCVTEPWHGQFVSQYRVGREPHVPAGQIFLGLEPEFVAQPMIIARQGAYFGDHDRAGGQPELHQAVAYAAAYPDRVNHDLRWLAVGWRGIVSGFHEAGDRHQVVFAGKYLDGFGDYTPLALA